VTDRDLAADKPSDEEKEAHVLHYLPLVRKEFEGAEQDRLLKEILLLRRELSVANALAHRGTNADDWFRAEMFRDVYLIDDL
jgi:hypothetical protein